MAVQLQVARNDGVAAIEEKLLAVTAALTPLKGRPLAAKLASDRRRTFFKDIWASMTLATGIDAASSTEITAWGLKDWAGLQDFDKFALSHPALIGIQRGASIFTDQEPRQMLEADAVRRAVTDARGLLGTEGARLRTLVELDPQAPRAEVLAYNADSRATFFDFMRETLHVLEIGAREKGQGEGTAPRAQIIEWLFELYTNGFQHARRDGSVRLFRVQKHHYPNRAGALKHAEDIPELASYIARKEERLTPNTFNLVEASVSDFGPGIVDGFLETPAGKTHARSSRTELLYRLLHDQLSSKSNDPSAGLGIRNALDAARRLDAFVSLRTAEFSLSMSGRDSADASLTFRGGPLARVVGTHWQLLLPDRSGPT